MSGKDDITDTEIADAINYALDDLDRVKAILGSLTVVLDDMRCRVMARHEDGAPGPWDDEHPDNGRGGRKVDMGRLFCQSLTIRSKQSGLFSSMPRRDRAVVAGAAFLFMMGQIIGALLNRFGYAWLWWL